MALDHFKSKVALSIRLNSNRYSLPRAPVFNIEQFAVTAVLGAKTRLSACNDLLVHYWGFARGFIHEQIAEFFPAATPASLPSALPMRRCHCSENRRYVLDRLSARARHHPWMAGRIPVCLPGTTRCVFVRGTECENRQHMGASRPEGVENAADRRFAVEARTCTPGFRTARKRREQRCAMAGP